MAFVGIEDQAGARAVVLDSGLWEVVLEVGQGRRYDMPVPLVWATDAGSNDLELFLVVVMLAYMG